MTLRFVIFRNKLFQNFLIWVICKSWSMQKKLHKDISLPKFLLCVWRHRSLILILAIFQTQQSGKSFFLFNDSCLQPQFWTACFLKASCTRMCCLKYMTYMTYLSQCICFERKFSCQEDSNTCLPTDLLFWKKSTLVENVPKTVKCCANRRPLFIFEG